MEVGIFAKDLSGQRFGRLVVLRRCGKTTWGAALWECSCDCGTTPHKVRAGHLLSGAVKSCGCLNPFPGVGSKRWAGYPRGYGPLLANYKGNAQRRNIEWTLTPEQAFALFRGVCCYCGCQASRTTKLIKTPYNGIDRRNSSLGYNKENCVSCCWDCNNFKGGMSYQDFVERIKKIYENMNL